MTNAHDLSLFVMVVEAESFNKAAQLAQISTPALSKKITKLEKELGVQLLYRTTRRLSLTEAGKALYHHARGINQQVNLAISSVSNFSDELSGVIKMTVPTISGELLLAQAVAEFCQLHPKVTVEMRLENEFVDLVKEGIDLAIRTGVLEDSSLIAKPLLQSNWVVCCAPAYIKRCGEPQGIDELIAHNCLAYTYQTKGAHDWRFLVNGIEQTVKINGNFSTNNAQALRQAALVGSGIVYVPRCSVYQDLLKGDLVELLTDFKPRSLGIYAVYPYTRYQPEKIRCLIEHIATAYQNHYYYF
ncbi:LysR family transcriptional regulator [Psychrobium sp. 1_MG-2023]|uniref:LysR family transcriptional regulator n=1 Tax=Psychrobium sp. 1_MG-2023 TaxID=3062624 RepID=UPI000C324C71|nr:LysR family transcriptional regulator [Psychrobium sp. 1_MG-2023]MDP2559674.1 LysR substrate-binding domain-containing protein [Psychrobium sp. 1_MG-2023]PKF59505.1 LysR family transcriptional regulator [Alteromonadales bacterium alter-6D02]